MLLNPKRFKANWTKCFPSIAVVIAVICRLCFEGKTRHLSSLSSSSVTLISRGGKINDEHRRLSPGASGSSSYESTTRHAVVAIISHHSPERHHFQYLYLANNAFFSFLLYLQLNFQVELSRVQHVDPPAPVGFLRFQQQKKVQI